MHTAPLAPISTMAAAAYMRSIQIQHQILSLKHGIRTTCARTISFTMLTSALVRALAYFENLEIRWEPQGEATITLGIDMLMFCFSTQKPIAAPTTTQQPQQWKV